MDVQRFLQQPDFIQQRWVGSVPVEGEPDPFDVESLGCVDCPNRGGAEVIREAFQQVQASVGPPIVVGFGLQGDVPPVTEIPARKKTCRNPFSPLLLRGIISVKC